MPGGVRLPKKPELPKEPARTTFDIWKPRQSFRTWREGIAATAIPQPQVFENTAFGNDEFRFWVGAEHSAMGICRCCRRPAWTVEERRAHLKTFGCAKILVEAYKLLLSVKKTKCVVCQEPTNMKFWGVPMCMNQVCMTKWKYAYIQWPSLIQAVAFAKAWERETEGEADAKLTAEFKYALEKAL